MWILLKIKYNTLDVINTFGWLYKPFFYNDLLLWVSDVVYENIKNIKYFTPSCLRLLLFLWGYITLQIIYDGLGQKNW